MERNGKAPENIRQDLPLARALAPAYREELSAILEYGTASLFLSPYLPAVADLFRETSEAEMKHFAVIGNLLRDLGGDFGVNGTVRTPRYRLNADADSHAPVVARRMLLSAAAEEERTAEKYRALSEKAPEGAARETLLSLSSEELAHAEAFAAMEKKLARS